MQLEKTGGSMGRLINDEHLHPKCAPIVKVVKGHLHIFLWQHGISVLEKSSARTMVTVATSGEGKR